MLLFAVVYCWLGLLVSFAFTWVAVFLLCLASWVLVFSYLLDCFCCSLYLMLNLIDLVVTLSLCIWHCCYLTCCFDVLGCVY